MKMIIITLLRMVGKIMQTYIHKTAQRLRVRSDFVRNHPAEVKQLLSQLQQIDAITDIKHKKHAGSVAICFDAEQMSADDLQELLESHNWMQQATKPSYIESAVVKGTKTLAKGVTVMALKQLVGPTFSRAILSI
ncbi:HMA2 domain-containing protein [Shewanella waksmanii]|uniref:HMA2 domain-containing protein n=1 Tax=Shewanella waksmanii TaxID=213783 RepID=UPI0037363DFD